VTGASSGICRSTAIRLGAERRAGRRAPPTRPPRRARHHYSDRIRRRFRLHVAWSPGTVRRLRTCFSSANSTPLRNRNFRRDSFDAATAALGLTITPHNLHHTAASLAIQAGASVVAVARLLGYESAATTHNHYAGLFPTDLHDAAVSHHRHFLDRCETVPFHHMEADVFLGAKLSACAGSEGRRRRR
jgi:integrase